MLTEHQPEHSRFLIKIEDDEALLEYHLLPDNRIDFHHTYVPVSGRGKGIAEQLVRAAMIWAQEQGYRVEASCSYVQRFLS